MVNIKQQNMDRWMFIPSIVLLLPLIHIFRKTIFVGDWNLTGDPAVFMFGGLGFLTGDTVYQQLFDVKGPGIHLLT
jgi:hypothetical protein